MIEPISAPRRERPRLPYEPPLKAWKGAAIAAGVAACATLLYLGAGLGSPLGGLGDVAAVLLAAALVAALVGGVTAGAILLLHRTPPVWGGAMAGVCAALAVCVGYAENPVFGLLLAVVLVLPAALLGGAVGLLAQRGWRKGTAWLLVVAVLLAAGDLYWLATPGGPRTAPGSASASAAAVPAVTAPNPGEPGTYQVRTLFYGSGANRRRPEFGERAAVTTATVDGTPFLKDWTGRRTWYWGFNPSRLPVAGRLWYPTGEGPFPLVLIVHGNHEMTDPSDAGYAYLGELLASRGYIVASVDENFLNRSGFAGDLGGGENAARAWLLLQHLQAFKVMNAEVGNPLFRRIDLGNIALVGHSRGGEAAYLAAVFNDLPYWPDDAAVPLGYHFKIRAVAGIAPVDGQYKPSDELPTLQNVNYLVLQGAADADVAVFMGLRQYDRVQFAEGGQTGIKAALYIGGANHGQFNTVWGRQDWTGLPGRLINTGPLMDGDQQRQIARVYLSAYLDVTLRGRSAYLPLLQDYRAGLAWLPDSTSYASRYEDGGTHKVSTFDEDLDLLSTTTPGGMEQGEGLAAWKEQGLRLRPSFPQENKALYLGWKRAEGQIPGYAIALPDARSTEWQVGSGSVLTFSLADSRTAAAKLQPLDLTVEVTDAAGNGARLPLSKWAEVPLPRQPARLYKLGPLETWLLGAPGPVLQTYRLPLADFTVGTRFDPAKLKTVRFRFDRTPAGAILLDDIGLAPGR
jgi:dienelactone hydrolase